jgi:hypothetical protein
VPWAVLILSLLIWLFPLASLMKNNVRLHGDLFFIAIVPLFIISFIGEEILRNRLMKEEAEGALENTGFEKFDGKWVKTGSNGLKLTALPGWGLAMSTWALPAGMMCTRISCHVGKPPKQKIGKMQAGKKLFSSGGGGAPDFETLMRTVASAEAASVARKMAFRPSGLGTGLAPTNFFNEIYFDAEDSALVVEVSYGPAIEEKDVKLIEELFSAVKRAWAK